MSFYSADVSMLYMWLNVDEASGCKTSEYRMFAVTPVCGITAVRISTIFTDISFSSCSQLLSVQLKHEKNMFWKIECSWSEKDNLASPNILEREIHYSYCPGWDFLRRNKRRRPVRFRFDSHDNIMRIFDDIPA